MHSVPERRAGSGWALAAVVFVAAIGVGGILVLTGRDRGPPNGPVSSGVVPTTGSADPNGTPVATIAQSTTTAPRVVEGPSREALGLVFRDPLLFDHSQLFSLVEEGGQLEFNSERSCEPFYYPDQVEPVEDDGSDPQELPPEIQWIAGEVGQAASNRLNDVIAAWPDLVFGRGTDHEARKVWVLVDASVEVVPPEFVTDIRKAISEDLSVVLRPSCYPRSETRQIQAVLGTTNWIPAGVEEFSWGSVTNHAAGRVFLSVPTDLESVLRPVVSDLFGERVYLFGVSG